MPIKLIYRLSTRHHFNFLTSVILLHLLPMAGIITSFWNEMKSCAARLGGRWKSWWSSLDQTLDEALAMCLKENFWFHHSNISSLSFPQLMAPPSCLSQKSKSHPNFISPCPLILAPFQLTTAGPVDFIYKINLKAIHFSPSVLLLPLSKLSQSLAPPTAMAS